MAHGIRHEAAQPDGPGTFSQTGFELSWVRAVDHVVGRCASSSGINLRDGVFEGFSALELSRLVQQKRKQSPEALWTLRRGQVR